MAKRNKKAAKVRTVTKTVTKTRNRFIKVKAAARRAASTPVTKTDIVLAVGGAGVGSIGGSILLAKMPAAVPDVAKNGILAAAGGFLAYKGIKKRNRLFMGLGLGAAAAGVTNLIGTVISGTGSTVAAPLAGPIPHRVSYAPARPTMAAPLAAPLAGCSMAAPFEGDDTI